MTFSESILAFQEVTIAELTAKIEAGQDLSLFVGRESCPYCHRFAPKLATVAK
ncbi:hypothetical protein ACVRY7_00050 [Streptococcus ictaluri]|uniref:Bacteriocin transport accessory protein n=1 Tax=Streptococcus ictaluri 707-05 TaxID=764299 RepID=G5JZR0_9STRE|nr:hypothetical protein [Streptococcus ictaluri]EHI70918.1 hypothetical protein STRIC_0774 [Streptococcus ictaluri 707-05]